VALSLKNTIGVRVNASLRLPEAFQVILEAVDCTETHSSWMEFHQLTTLSEKKNTYANRCGSGLSLVSVNVHA